MSSIPGNRGCRRRTFLTASAATAVAGGLGAAGRGRAAVARTVVIPAVDTFADNYEGQFLSILGRTAETPTDESDVEACEVPWPTERTQQDQGQLTDRRSEQPVAIRVPVYLDGREPDVAEGTLFIIDDARRCNSDHVVLETYSIPTRSVVGEPPGPTVAQAEVDEVGTGENGPGFGICAGILGVAGALAARALQSGE